MTYEVSLFPVGIVTALLLIFGHLPALVYPDATRRWLRAFPRSDFYAALLLAAGVVWTVWLVLTMDLGEFASMRQPIAIGAVVVGVLSWIFVREFLAVRALAILLLLAADVLLCAAFLQPPLSRLWLVLLAYGWIFGALFLAGLPWLLRDAINWVVGKKWRLLAAALGGIAYGVLLLFCAIAYWR